jgi:hypothetical protein
VTSGRWFVVHSAFEIWSAVAIDDFSSDTVGWQNPFEDNHRLGIEMAIKKDSAIPIQF